MQFGFHLTIDLYGCDFDKLNSLEECHNSLREAVEILDMKALIPPYTFKAASNEEQGGKDPGGITGFIVIAESHISIHTFAKRGFASIDVYSCKEFNTENAKNFFIERFVAADAEVHFINRGLKYPDKNIY